MKNIVSGGIQISPHKTSFFSLFFFFIKFYSDSNEKHQMSNIMHEMKFNSSSNEVQIQFLLLDINSEAPI